jgi:glycosyltransferase involved in cell wall biosynthesis
LFSALAHYRPEIIFYVPTASTTLMACVRSRVLKAYCPGATVVLVGLQVRRHGRLARRLIRHVAPELVCVQATDSQQYLERLGCSVGLLPSGVDTHTFRPVSSERRRELRARYDLRPDAPTILHVGHLRARRGVRVLAELTAGGANQVVLVTSSSTGHDADLAEELRGAGVTVLTCYQPHVEHLYQLADCYVFPVESAINAIEVPLSVLEALACDLPVVTTRFGGLPRLFAGSHHPGLVFVDSTNALVRAAAQLAVSPQRGTRPLALPYAWETVASSLLEQALARRAPATRARHQVVARGGE